MSMDPGPRPPGGRERREAVSDQRHRRESAGLYAIIIALLAMVAVPLGFHARGANWIWLGFGFASALVVSAFGIWRAAEWARWTAGILLLAATAALVLLPPGGVDAERSRSALDSLKLLGVAAPGTWLLLPKTGAEFRRIRELRAALDVRSGRSRRRS